MNKKIYKVTQTQLSSLQSNGFITVDGIRYDYDPNSLYILADPFAPEYRIETQGHNLHLLKDNVIISDLTVPFAQASVYASNAKNLQNKTGSKAYTYYDILPRVDYKDFLSINDLPMEGILCGISRNGYFYKVREEGTNTDIPFTLFCQTVDGYYSLSTSEITTPIEVYTIKDYFNEAKFIPYGTVKKVNNTEPDADGNITITIPLQIENIKDGTGNGSLNQIKDGTGTTFSIDDSSGNSKNPNAYALDNTIKGDIVFGGVGDYSTSLGGKSSAQGKRSVAQGTTTIAKGNYSHAEGDNSVALGPDSHAEGYATVTYGKASHSEGTSTQALGEGSHAEGSNTKATKTGAHSEGEETDASGYASHTEGLFNKVLSKIPADTGGSGSGITPPPSTGWNIEEHRGDAGHAEGYGNVVYGFASHAEGHQNKSSGHYSHSEGLLNTASGNYSHAEGTGCLASDTGAHAGGSYCYAITSNAFAHGQSLTTNIPNQAVFGEYNLDLPFSSRETQYLFAIGNGTDVNHRSNAFVSYKDGRAAIGKDPVNDFDVATKGYVDRGIGVKQDKITPTNKLPASNVYGLASVATSGSYNDLSNKPEIGDLVPYTGATKDVDLGKHSLFISNKDGNLNNPVIKLSSKGIEEDDVRTIIKPASISLEDPGLSWATLTPAYFDFEDGANSCTVRKDGFTASLKTVGPGGTDVTYSAVYKYDGIDVNNKKLLFPSKAGTIALESDIISIKNTYLSKNEAADYYVKKLGSTGEYKVYMSAPDGKDANRTIATAPIGSSVPIRTKEGHILLPDASVSMPEDNEAISAGVAGYLYGLDRKIRDFHPTTTLRWLNSSDQREMVINGSWIGFYKNGEQTTLLYPDKFTYLNKNVYWSDLAYLVENKTAFVKWSDITDLVENGTVLLNGDTGSIGSYTSVGNGVSSALNFAGQNISNTAKGVNSLSLGRLNSVEGAACFAYGNKNIIKGVASIAFGGGNTAGEKIDWTSLDAATNSSSSYCFAIGENNTSIGRASITIGTANNSKGDGSISIGRDNTIWSKESVAIGRSNTLNRVSTGSYDEQEPDQGNGVVAIGTGLKTPLRYREVDYSNNFYWNCVISGRYNDPYAYNCVRSSDLVYVSSLPPLFTLGNGLSDTSRNNAIVLFHNASAINSDFIYFNEYSIFNKKCEFRGPETIIEGTLKDASGAQYIKGGTITTSFINSLF